MDGIEQDILLTSRKCTGGETLIEGTPSRDVLRLLILSRVKFFARLTAPVSSGKSFGEGCELRVVVG